jgi:ABC-type spermidine/putrescine transport system permease subunit I
VPLNDAVALPEFRPLRLRARRRGAAAFLLILPTSLIYAALLVGPLANLLIESLRPYVGGRIGGSATGWTLENYGALLHEQYAVYFGRTLELSLIACAVGVLLAYPVAHHIARTRSRRQRRLWINLLVSSLFLDALIRCYALVLFFGPTGVVLPILHAYFGILGNNAALLQCQVVIGLLYLVIPIYALTLVGPIENINPRLAEAALTLGASYWKSILVTDVALSLPAIFSSFLIVFTLCITSFIVPLILGQGFIIFIANLIAERFFDSANYPSGAALSILLLVLVLTIVYLTTRIVRLVSRASA